MKQSLPNTLLGGEPQPQDDVLLAKTVIQRVSEWRTARSDLEKWWTRVYAAHQSSREALRYLRDENEKGGNLGDVVDDWRATVSMGQVFEITETMVAYLVSAAIPKNRDWFNVNIVELFPDATQEDYKQYMLVIKLFMQYVLNSAKYPLELEKFVRQLSLIGTSGFALPWYDKGQTNEFEVMALDMFDVYLDPQATDCNKADLVRILRKRPEELIHLYESGYYDKASRKVIEALTANSQINPVGRQIVQNAAGIQTTSTATHIEIYEFWGNLRVGNTVYEDVVVTTTSSGVLLRAVPNPYKGLGKPFVFCNYVEVVGTPYGFSPLLTAETSITTINRIMGQRIDATELGLDAPIFFDEDAVGVNKEMNWRVGEMIPIRVAQGKAVQNMLYRFEPAVNSLASIQDIQTLRDGVGRTTGVDGVISSPGNTFGNRDRVTLGEVTAKKDAGGARLTAMYNHMEQQALIPMLTWVYHSCRRYYFKGTRQTVNVPIPGTVSFAKVNSLLLDVQCYFMPVMSGVFAEKEKQIQDFLDWYQIVSQVPPEAGIKLDHEKCLDKITQLILGQSIQDYLIVEEPAPQSPMMGMQPTPQDMANMMTGEQAAMLQQAQMAGTEGIQGANAIGQLPISGNPLLQGM